MKKLLLILACCWQLESLSQSVTPHPVPEEFTSTYYEVTVNGQSVPVFHAGLNVCFASFDFTGNANVSVKANYKNARYSGQTAQKWTLA